MFWSVNLGRIIGILRKIGLPVWLIAFVASFAGLIFGDRNLCNESDSMPGKKPNQNRNALLRAKFPIVRRIFWFLLISASLASTLFFKFKSGGRDKSKQGELTRSSFFIFKRFVLYLFRWNVAKPKICSLTSPACSLKQERHAGKADRIAASQLRGSWSKTELGITVCVKFLLYSPCLCGFPRRSPVSSQLPKHIMIDWLANHIGKFSPRYEVVHSHFTSRFPTIGMEATETLTRIKQLWMISVKYGHVHTAFSFRGGAFAHPV